MERPDDLRFGWPAVVAADPQLPIKGAASGRYGEAICLAVIYKPHSPKMIPGGNQTQSPFEIELFNFLPILTRDESLDDGNEPLNGPPTAELLQFPFKQAKSGAVVSLKPVVRHFQLLLAKLKLQIL